MVNLKELKIKSRDLKPILQIGKNGLSDSVIKEINVLLKKKKLLKIKLTRGALDNMDKKEIAKLICEKTDSFPINQIGFVLVIYPNKYLK